MSVIQTFKGLLCLFDERPQSHALISPFTVLGVEVVLLNVFYYRVWDQVFDAQSPSESPPDLCCAGLVPYPFFHLEHISAQLVGEPCMVHDISVRSGCNAKVAFA